MARGLGKLSTKQKATVSLAWFAIVVGTLLGVGTLYYSVVSLSAGSPEFASILLFIGGVFATTLIVSGLRLRRGSGPARLEVPWGATTGARRKAADLIGWLAMVCGALLGCWSIYNAATRPKPNELDVIERSTSASEMQSPPRTIWDGCLVSQPHHPWWEAPFLRFSRSTETHGLGVSVDRG
jgi:hypothetical protein